MKILIGLGNPGDEYVGTRHNLGFEVADGFCRVHRFRAASRECRASIFRGRIRGEEILVAKPETYMNRSGEAVACLATQHGLAPGDLVVICDDMALDLGVIRLRRSGSDGGHLGLRSITKCLQSEEFPRLRVGIRSPEALNGDLSDRVLDPFTESEQGEVAQAVERAVQCLYAAVVEGVPAAMNRFNRRPPERAGETDQDTPTGDSN